MNDSQIIPRCIVRSICEFCGSGTMEGTIDKKVGTFDPGEVSAERLSMWSWSGIAQVYLDGALQGTIDTYSAGQQAQAVVYSISGLGNASHNLTLVAAGTRNANSGGSWIWVDAFDVSVASAATTTAAPPAPRWATTGLA